MDCCTTKSELLKKYLLFILTTLSVAAYLLPRTFYGFDLTDTFFSLELQVLLERKGPVYWNYIFLTNYIGLLWIKVCPITNLFWWCHLGGCLLIGLSYGITALIADKLLRVSKLLIGAAAFISAVMISWYNCSLLINYYTVPTFFLTLILYLVLFIKRKSLVLCALTGALSAVLIGSRWPTAILLVTPLIYCFFRMFTDDEFKIGHLKQFVPATVAYIIGLLFAGAMIYCLMNYYDVFDRNPSGVHRGIEYAGYYLKIYLFNYPLIYAGLILYCETLVKHFLSDEKKCSIGDCTILAAALAVISFIVYFWYELFKTSHWEALVTHQHFLYAVLGYYVLLRFFVSFGIVKKIADKCRKFFPATLPAVDKKEWFAEKAGILLEHLRVDNNFFSAYILTYICVGILFPFGSDGIFYYNFCMLPLIWSIFIIYAFYSLHVNRLRYYHIFIILLLLASGVGLTYYSTYRDSVATELTKKFETPKLDLVSSTPYKVENIDKLLAFIENKVSADDQLLVIGQESFYYFHLKCQPWEQWLSYKDLQKRLLTAKAVGNHKLPAIIIVSLLKPEYQGTAEMIDFMNKNILNDPVYKQIFCSDGYLVYAMQNRFAR